MKVKKINLIILIVLLVVLFVMFSVSLLGIDDVYAEEVGTISGNIIDPLEGNYEYIGKPVSTCINGDDLYIADKSNNKVYIYNKDSLVLSENSQIELNFAPKKIRYGDGKLYILDNSSKLHTYSDETLTQLETEVFDFDISNNKIVIAFNSSKIRFSELNGSSQTEIHYDGEIRSVAIAGGVPYYISRVTGSNVLNQISAGNSAEISSGLMQTLLAGSSTNLIVYSSMDYRIYSNGSLGNVQSFEEKSVLDVFCGEVQVRIDETCNAVVVGDKKICYISTDENHVFNPIDITTRNGKVFSLDEKQIKVIENGETVQMIDVSLKLNKRAIVVDENEVVYLVLNNQVIKFDEDGNETVITNSLYTNFSDATACVDGNVYILDSQNKVLKLSGGTIEPFLDGISAQKIACNLKSPLIYLLNGNVITVYNIADKHVQTTISTGKSSIKDFQVDFNANIFVVYNEGQSFNLVKYAYNENYTFVYNKAINNSIINPKNVVSFAINDETGELLFSDKELSYIISATKDDAQSWGSRDIPQIAIPNSCDVKNFNFGNGSKIKIGIVESFPSTLLYPVHTNFSSNSEFPTGYMHDKTIVLENNKEVIIVDETNPNYYYVIADGSVGFILKDRVKLKQSTIVEPYLVESLQSTLLLYSYPSEKSDVISNSIVSRFPIKANDELLVLKKSDSPQIYVVSNVLNFEGGKWLEVSYEGKSAFVLYNTVIKKNQSTTSNIFSYGKISTTIGGGDANVYRLNDLTSDVVGSLSDNTRVKVFFKVDGFAYVRYETDGHVLKGYIEESYLLKNGLTATQLMLVIIILSVIVLSIGTLIAVRIFKR